jgi:zinc transporter 5/7
MQLSNPSHRSIGVPIYHSQNSHIPHNSYDHQWTTDKSYYKKSYYSIIYTFIVQMSNDPKTKSVFFFLCLNLTFTFVEAAYGIWTNSLGLFSDAVHMLFDSTAIILSLIASVIAKWDANEKFTFGYGRVEVLTGFTNSLALFFAGAGIIWEAIERLINPQDLHTDRLLLVAVLGLMVNLGEFSLPPF